MRIDFSRIAGQKQAKAFLETAVKNGDIASAYLFEGPRGVGKATFALEFAKALNCENLEVKPCNECGTCRRIGAMSYPDLILLLPGNPDDWLQELGESGRVRPPSYDPSKEISINQIRELKEELSKAPYEGKYRVVLVLNAENLSLEAQNAFLKTLEEPPKRTTFILISSEPDRVLPTVISRARRVKFTALKEDEFLSLPFLGENARLLYKLSGGSPGIALLLKETNLLEVRNSVLQVLRDHDFDTLKNEIAPMFSSSNSKGELLFFINVYQSIIRDIYLLKFGVKSELLVNSDLYNELKRASNKLPDEKVGRLFQKAFEAEDKLRKNVNRELLIYTMFSPLFD